MQSLYATERHKEAYHEIARNNIASRFSVDPNSMEEQNKEELQLQKKEALQAFDLIFDNKEIKLSDYPEATQTALTDEQLTFQNEVSAKEDAALRELIEESDRLAASYVKVLFLLVEWRDLIIAEWNKAIGSGKDLGGGFRNLDKNPFINALEENAELIAVRKKNKLNWDTETLQDWFRKIVRKDEEYINYSSKPEPTLEDHLFIINYLFKKIFFKNEIIEGYMEANDLGWTENHGILKSMVVKTIKTFNPDDSSVQVIRLSPNWDEDKEFFIKLYKETVKNSDQLEEIIASRSKNWDVERIAATDLVILKMATAEMMHFPSIPVKVTINEYIEICKLYSTPKSKQYVNGILDVLSTELTKEGLIKKSGRGLLDNK
ncbi:MAG: transcription antitermination factor NusB [Cyclobacteriaceae bacterium]